MEESQKIKGVSKPKVKVQPEGYWKSVLEGGVRHGKHERTVDLASKKAVVTKPRNAG